MFGLDVEGRQSGSGDGADGGADRRYGVGFGWELSGGHRVVSEFSIRFGGERRESAGEPPEHRFGVRMTVRW